MVLAPISPLSLHAPAVALRAGAPVMPAEPPTFDEMVASKKLDATPFVSHTFELDDIIEAYDVFGRAAETKALKVILEARA